MIAAVVPAAGQSRRMGRQKLALRLGDRTVLERIVATLRTAEIDPIIVVLGPDTADLAAVAANAGAQVCTLAERTAEMRATVEFGLRYLEERFQPHPDDAWLLAPADHPSISPAVIQALSEQFRRSPSRPIIVPVHAGHRGHPTLFAWRQVEAIRALAAGEGINALLASHFNDVIELPVDDPGILIDLNTPADLQRWQQRSTE